MGKEIRNSKFKIQNWMCWSYGVIVIFAAVVAMAGEAARPGEAATRPVDPALWNRMLAVDQRSANIIDLTARFEQEKFTALLKKPLLSGGVVRVRGSGMRWDTNHPEPTVLRLDEREVRIYYPRQKIIEVYGIEQKLASLAASPLPRLDVLKQHFSFEELAVDELDKSVDPSKYLALKMKPTEPALREHVDEVRVLLDIAGGYLVRLEIIDSDGDRSVIRFSDVKINTGLTGKDLEIKAPADVKIVHPLAAVEGQ
jgi:outer membrane lipoprotein-sorting protein